MGRNGSHSLLRPPDTLPGASKGHRKVEFGVKAVPADEISIRGVIPDTKENYY
jgi:hypothetical protein